MGLDMYLTKRTYVGNKYRSEEEKLRILIDKNTPEHIRDIKKDRISYVIEDVGYWRKSNHIHQFFVDNVQNGDDNCREYYVYNDVLKELIDICKQILENNDLAEELLPTQAGFFFGGVEYGTWYYNDLKETVAMIEPLLEEGGEFYYQSSW